MKLLFFILLLANILAFGYIGYAETRAGDDTQLAHLQINPEKLKLISPSVGKSSSASGKASQACLEWGSFSAAATANAAAALARLNLGAKLVQREESGGYWVYLSPAKSKGEADKRTADMKGLGVSDSHVLPDLSIALGVFKTEEAANNYLAQITQKGISTAVVGPRAAPNTTFVVHDPSDATAAAITELKRDYPSTQLRATQCTNIGLS